MGIERGAIGICRAFGAKQEVGNKVWELNGMLGELCGAVQHSSSSHVDAPFTLNHICITVFVNGAVH